MRTELSKALSGLTLLVALSGCGLTSTQAVYEGVRAQEKAKAVGSGQAPAHKLPPFDQYQKERSSLLPWAPSLQPGVPP